MGARPLQNWSTDDRYAGNVLFVRGTHIATEEIKCRLSRLIISSGFFEKQNNVDSAMIHA